MVWFVTGKTKWSENIALNGSIGDLNNSFHFSGTALASNIFKVGCKSVPFFQFLAADLPDFLFGVWVRCSDFCLFSLSSKVESQIMYKTIIHIIWYTTVHGSLSICFFNWRQHSQIIVIFIWGTFYITVIFSVRKEVNSIIQWKAKKWKSNIRLIVTICFMNKIFPAFWIQAFTSICANTEIQTIALYSTIKDKKGKVPN